MSVTEWAVLIVLAVTLGGILAALAGRVIGWWLDRHCQVCAARVDHADPDVALARSAWPGLTLCPDHARRLAHWEES